MNKKLSIFLIILVVIIDQVSKFLVQNFGVELTLNKGISFNYLTYLPSSLITVAIMMLTLFIFILFKKDWLKHSSASALFFGGAVANIIDRIFYGGVRDWLPVPFFNIQNNLADWAIFLGLALVVVFSFRGDKV